MRRKMEKFNFLVKEDLGVFMEKLNYEQVDERDGEGDTILHKAVEVGTLSYIQAILDAGADVNARNKKGNTGAHLAAMIDAGDIFQLLLDYGSDLCIRNNNQRNPEDVARINKSKRVEKLLKNYSEDSGYTVKIQAHKKWEDD